MHSAAICKRQTTGTLVSVQPLLRPRSCALACFWCLQERQAQVEERVKALEAELAGLRQEAAQLKERRSWAQQHHQQLLAKIKVFLVLGGLGEGLGGFGCSRDEGHLACGRSAVNMG